jgi:polysaccharide chain length determinant protein (PEP-CTERM system associated)
MAQQDGRSFNLDLVRGIWSRRKWLAVVLFVLPLAATVGAIPFLPNVYKASAVVLVERQQVPEEFVRSTVTSGLETRLHTMSQEILSRTRLGGLIERFGLYPALREEAPPQSVVERMRRDIQIEPKGVESIVRGGALVAFTISYLGSDPKTIAAVANTLASYYLDENTRVRERQASGTAEFLRRQLHEVKQRLEKQETLVSAFKQRYIGETPQQVQGNLVVLERLGTQLRLNSENQNRAADRREALARQAVEAESLATLFSDPALNTTGGPGPVLDPAAGRLSKLRQELVELRTRFSEKYPDVVRLNAEIAALEREIGERAARAEAEAPKEAPKRVEMAQPNPFALQLKESLAEVETELKTLRAEEKRIRDDMALYQRRVDNAPRREQEFIELSRDYDTTSDLYRTLLKRYEEAQLAETLEQRQKGEQFRILEAAVPPGAPVAPNRQRLFLVGVVASLGLALGAVMLAEQLDSSFHSLDELRGFTPVVVASIPRIVTDADARRRRWRFRLAATAVLLSVMLVGLAAHVVAKRSEQVVWSLARGRS